MARILVIDDDAGGRALLAAVLRSEGHQVAEATDGATGVLACRGNAFDLALCDLDLLGGGGLEALAQMRRAFPRLPVLALSSSDDLEMVLLARCLGAIETLRKPFGVASVLGAVGEALGNLPAGTAAATPRG